MVICKVACILKALLIIDQQKGIDHPKLGKRNNPQAEDVMHTILSLWRTKCWPVFHIQHRSKDPESVFWPEQDGFELKDGFLPKEGEYLIEKSVPCAFTNNVLEGKLRDLAITDILIVGVATHNSVESTARTGGNLGFSVTVIEDACYTFGKTDFDGNPKTAQDVHAMSLANLHGEYATVKHSEDFIVEIEKG